LTGGAAETLAGCLIGTGKLDEAGTLLQNIDAKTVAQLTGVPDWAAHLELAEGEIAYKRGDYEGARKHLLAAAPAFSCSGAEPYQKRRFETLSADITRRLAQR
jgi:ATP/maltotriose-dependent transcriptional regulator MalT